jgi:hypothetical protein
MMPRVLLFAQSEQASALATAPLALVLRRVWALRPRLPRLFLVALRRRSPCRQHPHSTVAGRATRWPVVASRIPPQAAARAARG